MNRFFISSLWLASAVALLVGCGNGEAKRINDLKQTGLAWHIYHEQHNIGPNNWTELIASAKDHNMDPVHIERVRDAGYELTWGLKFSEAKAGASNTVLGKPPGNSGPKLMLDGSVRK
ncbi:hypothetical protein [Anatilimnocola floriformis]|uniref:hypothetical protein n=1 Tax=Anatilimnocola floriformis TaxID=2948575 RepID=UPI0020C36038|nr:hypothetical protein [Anatilimnocola floriformis]